MDEYYCEEYSYQFLDKIDFLPYIEKFKGKKFTDMMIEIEDEWDSKDIVQNDNVLEGFLFNYITENEFADYLKNRYDNFGYYEVVTKYIY